MVALGMRRSMRIVWVMINEETTSAWAQRVKVLEASLLDISLVVIGPPGHFLEADIPENRSLREAFIPAQVKTEPNWEPEAMEQLIVAAVKKYEKSIDAIFTEIDGMMVGAAGAAEILDCSYLGSKRANQVAASKWLSRQLQNEDHSSIHVSGVEELEHSLRAVTTPEGINLDQASSRSALDAIFSPQYPLVVKPEFCNDSRGVKRVNDRAELVKAVEDACSWTPGAVVIEPYVSGPEINIELAIYQGKVYWEEVSDEMPTRGDWDAAINEHQVADAKERTFSAVSVMMPSQLPAREQEIAIQTATDLVLKAGFESGFFHVEGRMINSSCGYRQVDGIVDLHPHHGHDQGWVPDQEPSFFLLEINPRPASGRITDGAQSTYGVNYTICTILLLAGEVQRLRHYCTPNVDSSLPQPQDMLHKGARCWTEVVYIPVPQCGTLLTEDPIQELKSSNEELRAAIVGGRCYYKKGDAVQMMRLGTADAVQMMRLGTAEFVAFVIVESHQSRRQARILAERARRFFKVEIQ